MRDGLAPRHRSIRLASVHTRLVCRRWHSYSELPLAGYSPGEESAVTQALCY
jgi:hypothetical protein